MPPGPVPLAIPAPDHTAAPPLPHPQGGLHAAAAEAYLFTHISSLPCSVRPEPSGFTFELLNMHQNLESPTPAKHATRLPRPHPQWLQVLSPLGMTSGPPSHSSLGLEGCLSHSLGLTFVVSMQTAISQGACPQTPAGAALPRTMLSRCQSSRT